MHKTFQVQRVETQALSENDCFDRFLAALADIGQAELVTVVAEAGGRNLTKVRSVKVCELKSGKERGNIHEDCKQ